MIQILVGCIKTAFESHATCGMALLISK